VHPLHITQPKPDVLAIDWQDGSRSMISARELRRFCPCSECSSRRHQASTGFIPIVGHVSEEIAALDLIGSSALHVTWADGHARSIYRYEYLRTIAPPRMPDGGSSGTTSEE
jgi:prepilin-type processing-associated H-X9-DG protein